MRKIQNNTAAKKQPARKDRLLSWAIRLLLLVGIVSGVVLGIYVYQSMRSAQDFDRLRAQMQTPATQNQRVKQETAVPELTEEEKRAAEQAQTAAVLAGMETLQAQNADMVAWLTIPNTSVDYPVMLTPDDPEFYLHKNFEKAYSAGGVPFLDDACSVEPQSDNLIVYGHNMKNGSMFASLLKYRDAAYWQAHPEIWLYISGEKQIYDVVAAFSVTLNQSSTFKFYEMINADSEQAYDSYIAKAKSLTPYDTAVTASYGDKLLTLSTCAYHARDGRYVVIARAREQA